MRQFDVFLSHNHNDSARVESLARTLVRKARTARLARQVGNASPASWSRSARSASATAASRSSSARRRRSNSKWVAWEIEKHLEFNPEGDRLLPVKFEPLRASDGTQRAALGRFHRSGEGRRERRTPRAIHPLRRRRGCPPPARIPPAAGPRAARCVPAAAAVWFPGPGEGALRAGTACSAGIAASCCMRWAAWARPRWRPRPRSGGRGAGSSATARASSASSSLPARTASSPSSANTAKGRSSISAPPPSSAGGPSSSSGTARC